MQDGFILDNGKTFFRNSGQNISLHTLDGVVSVSSANGYGCNIGLSNGLSVSVQWNSFNYCSNRHATTPNPFSPDAEVAVVGLNGNLMQLSDYDSVLGWQSPSDVISIIQKYASLKNQVAHND